MIGMMKKRGLVFLLLIVLIVLVAAFCGGWKKKSPPKTQDPPTPPQDEISYIPYRISEDQKEVTFVFDEKAQDKSEVSSVCVAGTFNEWKTGVEGWQLEKKKDGVWELTVSTDRASVPGNSGYAEFKYVINSGNWVDPMPNTPQGYTFKGNNLIVFPGDDLNQIIADEKLANTIKGPNDFDLENEEDLKIIANFRLVPGTQKFFRSYHPCRESKNIDPEVRRLEFVNKFLEGNGIKSIISLCGEYELDKPDKYKVSDYVKAIIDGGNLLAIDSSYEEVYYRSDTPEFAQQIKRVIEFIIDPAHPAPFLVHCRLGTDRTGVVSAIIAALCGASWEEICADYQKSNEVGMDEFRSVKLLQYSLEKMLKIKITNEVDLQDAISNYFINSGYLNATQIESLRTKLKN